MKNHAVQVHPGPLSTSCAEESDKFVWELVDTALYKNETVESS